MRWIISVHLEDEFGTWIDFSAKQQSQVYCQGNSIGTKRRKIGLAQSINTLKLNRKSAECTDGLGWLFLFKHCS